MNKEILNFNINNKVRNLSNKASGVVSSTKYFPVFIHDNEEVIFKPLSKTKPYSTPLFSYSEVYWSYLINKYIDNNTPIYNLAYCKGLSYEQDKYYEKGCIVRNILDKDESLINILELYKKYPDNLVDIDDYINYCEVQYDYSNILNSTFFLNNKDIGEKLAEQILCSILRRDDNYHYENVSLIEKNNKIIGVAPIIDQEFSQMFMYPDKEDVHKLKFSYYDEGMLPIFNYDEELSYVENYDIFVDRIKNDNIYDMLDKYKYCNLRKNLYTIVDLYPDMVVEFINKLKLMKEEIINLDISFDKEFIGSFSSDDWVPTRMIYKDKISIDNDSYKIAKKISDNNKIELDEDEFNSNLKKEVIWSIDKLIDSLSLYLDVKNRKIIDLKNYKNDKTLYEPVERKSDEILYLIFEKYQKNKNSIVKRKNVL